ncbi:hypothetical protein M408DRAFT_327071 [Serendipita vermifera MAFF 305830]|uniref:Uncharacterized protein n=1 Tax=Serendipita vermifera MAFF 305830 TaxID=933852 RepID=A0A0C2X2P8_SERVB|nr:hypothetical protein M408DRAFT_327071 [Serendipita vermifera MAFF 305830]
MQEDAATQWSPLSHRDAKSEFRTIHQPHLHRGCENYKKTSDSPQDIDDFPIKVPSS